jgi:hypothetical protein
MAFTSSRRFALKNTMCRIKSASAEICEAFSVGNVLPSTASGPDVLN